MASALTHAFVAVAAGKAVFPERMPARFWWLAVLCSAAPDLDAIGFHLGVDYHHAWGHRGMTHSVFFAAVVAVVVVLLAFRKEAPPGTRRFWTLIAFFFALTASHGLLDAFTDGGLGIALLAPFSDERIFWPWRPVQVSPIGVRAFFSRWGLSVMISELLWIWLPVGAAACGAILLSRRVSAGRRSPTTDRSPPPA